MGIGSGKYIATIDISIFFILRVKYINLNNSCGKKNITMLTRMCVNYLSPKHNFKKKKLSYFK